MKKQPVIKEEVLTFLHESNEIEGIYAEDAFNSAIFAYISLMAQTKLSVRAILQIHKTLMRTRSAWDDATATMVGKAFIGRFRDGDVYIGGHKALRADLIEPALEAFVKESNKKNPDWQKLHIEYERIHPFFDGNGRTGRLLMNWTRIKRCNLPLLIIKNSEKEDYYKWFRNDIW